MRQFIKSFGILAILMMFVGCFGIGGWEHNRLNSTVTVSPKADLKRAVIVIADFESTKGEKYNDGVSTYTPFINSGSRMADIITVKLMAFPQYRIVERNRLKHVLEELQFQMTDLIEPDKLKKVGRLLGADAVVFGRAEGWAWINRFGWGNSLDTSFRLVDIETGEVFWATEGAIVRVNTTVDVYQLLAEDISNRLISKMNTLIKP